MGGVVIGKIKLSFTRSFWRSVFCMYCKECKHMFTHNYSHSCYCGACQRNLSVSLVSFAKGCASISPYKSRASSPRHWSRHLHRIVLCTQSHSKKQVNWLQFSCCRWVWSVGWLRCREWPNETQITRRKAVINHIAFDLCHEHHHPHQPQVSMEGGEQKMAHHPAPWHGHTCCVMRFTFALLKEWIAIAADSEPIVWRAVITHSRRKKPQSRFLAFVRASSMWVSTDQNKSRPPYPQLGPKNPMWHACDHTFCQAGRMKRASRNIQEQSGNKTAFWLDFQGLGGGGFQNVEKT